MRKSLFIAALALFAIAVTSCKDDDPATVPVTEVKVAPTTAGVLIDGTVTLTATVLPNEATNKTVTWTSKHPEIASVVDGVVTGLSAGVADIEAKAGGKTAIAKVTVSAEVIPVVSVTMSQPTLGLLEGQTQQLSFTLDPEDATNQEAAWESDNDDAATVSQDGLVTAVAEGTANITVTVDGKSDVCVVTVSVPEDVEIVLPYLKDVADNTVSMEAEGFFAEGDQIKVEDFFGFSGTAEVKNVTDTGAEFDLPEGATKDRTYMLTVSRGGTAKAQAVIRYDDDMVQVSPSLGYALTDDGEVTDKTAAELGINESVARGGYLSPAAVFTFNETDGTFDASAADLKLCTLTPSGGVLNLDYVVSDDLSVLGNFNLGGVTKLQVSNTGINALDMTLFPNCETLIGAGDGANADRFSSVDFGTYGTDPVSKLKDVELSNNQIAGTINMLQLPSVTKFAINNNQLDGIEFGQANVDPIHLIYELYAENNNIRELSIENCGTIRKLLVGENPIERLTLLNNSTQANGIQYMFLFKAIDTFTFDPVSAADALGERRIDVEHYWWRVFSEGTENCNQADIILNGLTPYPGDSTGKTGWLNDNPIVKALADGYTVQCWTYIGEDGPESAPYPIEGHLHVGGVPCTY